MRVFARFRTVNKRLKTQNTAFRGNENGKGTPSGVPQPIHKRKLILVKEEFDASSFGGDEGDRTPDLLTASQALSQLSYAPVTRRYYRGMSLGMQEGILGLLLCLRIFLTHGINKRSLLLGRRLLSLFFLRCC